MAASGGDVKLPLDFGISRIYGAPMLNTDVVLSPDKCRDMTAVRAGVDAVDAELIDLLALRFGYMDAAARIKPDRNTVRDEARKRTVIENAVAGAKKRGIPAGAIAEIWEQLVEASIAYELGRWDGYNETKP
jgi:isochorismate pyruvate lyase